VKDSLKTIGQQQQKTTKTCKNGCMMDVKIFFIA